LVTNSLLHLRKLYREDMSDILLLVQACKEVDGVDGLFYRYTESMITAFLEGLWLYGLYLNGQLIGYCSFSPKPSFGLMTKKQYLKMFSEDLKLPRSKYGILYDCFVHPNYRGAGYQYLMLRHRLDIAKKLKFSHVLVSVLPTNIYSKSNIEDAGFIFIGNKLGIIDSPKARSLYFKLL
jgi:GNAT superfamily N-acetyltransferase